MEPIMQRVHERGRPLTVLAVVSAAFAFSWASPSAADPKGYIEVESGVGYVYSTFDENPNVVLLAGGTVEEFCEDDPEDPFNAEPGTTPSRVFARHDGTIDIKVETSNQPVHLYEMRFPGAPMWIAQVCEAYFVGAPAPTAFASGTAKLKVRVSVESESVVDVFNSVSGTATGSDGTEYTVRASADLVVVDGVPVGDPEDFVNLSVRRIGR